MERVEVGLEMPDLAAYAMVWLRGYPGDSASADMVQESDGEQDARQQVGVDTQLPGAGGPHVDEAVVVHIQEVPVLVEPVR